MLIPRKLVQIGAGKIGRSFIAQVFSRAGYETVFVDVDQELIDRLNQKKSYSVVIKSDAGDEKIKIQNIRAIHFNETEKAIEELTTAGIACVSAGQKGMMAAIPLLAEATLKRHYKKLPPLDVIIAENIRNADQIILEHLKPLLPGNFPYAALPGLIETSIGKMVPIMTQKDILEDPLQIFAEPYNSLIVARKGFRSPVPEIPYLAPKDNIKAWVDRKLFIHNLGHSTLAWLAFAKDPAIKYIWEAVADKELRNTTEATMLQSAAVLMKIYPEEFTWNDLDRHIHDLLTRFGNKALRDTIFRVGCDLSRKLGPNDRMIAPLSAAVKHNLPFNHILDAWLIATSFRATDEKGNMHPNDQDFANKNHDDLRWLLQRVAGFTGEEANIIISRYHDECKYQMSK